jgi:hypothetical protein
MPDVLPRSGLVGIKLARGWRCPRTNDQSTDKSGDCADENCDNGGKDRLIRHTVTMPQSSDIPAVRTL